MTPEQRRQRRQSRRDSHASHRNQVAIWTDKRFCETKTQLDIPLFFLFMADAPLHRCRSASVPQQRTLDAAVNDTFNQGRPDKPVPGPDAMCERVVFRVTRDERAGFEAAAKYVGKSLSEYVRGRAMRLNGSEQVVTPRQAGRDVDLQAIAALNRTGLSLLQMAERLTTVGAPVPEELHEAVGEVRDAISALMVRR